MFGDVLRIRSHEVNHHEKAHHLGPNIFWVTFSMRIQQANPSNRRSEILKPEDSFGGKPQPSVEKPETLRSRNSKKKTGGTEGFFLQQNPPKKNLATDFGVGNPPPMSSFVSTTAGSNGVFDPLFIGSSVPRREGS